MATTTDGASAPPAGSAPPADGVARLSLTAQDATASEHLMRGLYADASYRLRGPGADGPPHLLLEGVDSGGLHSGRLRCGQASDVAVGPSADVITSLLLSGSLRAAGPGEDLRALRPGSVLTCVTGAGLRASYGTDATFGMLRVPRRAVAAAAASTGGLPESGAVRILSTRPVDDAAEQYWAQLMAFTHRQLSAPGTPLANPLLAEHWVQSLAAAALRVFPNTTMTSAADGLPSAGAVGPATLRRAVAHAEAHAHLPLGVADLAAAAGVGVRALQLAYTQHLGTTPMAHLRGVRLDRAHAELRAGDTAVASVAARWGFTSPSAFATAYRRAFGCSPSDTRRS